MADNPLWLDQGRPGSPLAAHPDVAKPRVRSGYFRIYILLRREGWIVNGNRVYRLYREEGLSLRLKGPRRHVRAANRERSLRHWYRTSSG